MARCAKCSQKVAGSVNAPSKVAASSGPCLFIIGRFFVLFVALVIASVVRSTWGG